jgi:hypothetical protein
MTQAPAAIFKIPTESRFRLANDEAWPEGSIKGGPGSADAVEESQSVGHNEVFSATFS